jgi:hypothetical protein
MKTRELQSISDDASKIKCIEGSLESTIALKKLHQRMLGHLEKVLDNLE